MAIQQDSFIFNALKGETPQTLAKKRALAEAMVESQGVPRNVGEGLAGLGKAIAYRRMMGKIEKGEAAGAEMGKAAWSPVAAALAGQGAAPAASPLSGVPADQPTDYSANTTPTKFSGSQEEFVSMLMPAAMEASQRTGIDPRIIVAQAAQETGWGKSAPGNNFFGIKSHGQGGGQSLATHEYVNGKRVNVTDSFRGYSSPQDSVAGYADFISQNPRYKPLMSAQGLDAQLEALQASGYATDPNYSRSVGSIARGLTVPSAAAAPTQVASLDPASGISQATNGAEAATAFAGGDPAPALPAARSIADTPVAQPGQQVAQAMVQQPSGGPSMQQLMEAASNPWVPEGQRRIAQSLIEQQMQQQDPMRQLQMKKLEREVNTPVPRKTAVINGRLVDEQTGQVIAEYADQVKPTSDIQEFEYAKQRGYEGDFVQFQLAQKKAGASSVTTNVGEGNKFYDKLDENNAKMFSDLSTQGVDAQSKAVQIDQLESLLAGAPSGAAAVFKQAAGEYGIETEGLSDIQAAQALINQMVPTQRVPGSGTMSDADLALFKASLPRLINTPDGNKTIIQTMRGMTQYQQQMGEIADAVANRSMSPEEGRKALRTLPNPLAGLRKALPKTGTAKPSEGVSRPASKAEYDSLPSGAQFEAPDGSIRRKP